MMKAIDFRNANFERLKAGLEGMRREVYVAWLVHGPGTTRGLAKASGIDLLTLRPRTTELVDVGLVRCVGGENGEGIYEAVPAEDWEAWRRDRVEGQLSLI